MSMSSRLRKRRFALIFAGCLGSPVLLLLLGWLLLPLVPLPRELFQPPPPALEITDINGEPLRLLPDRRGLDSQRVAFKEIPQSLIQATLAAEDNRFWRHRGVDWRATTRACLSLVRHRRVISGGSTITQQLIKLAAPRRRTFGNKLVEAVQALRLEQVWSKERVLSEYLNRLDYGNQCVGCAAGAQFYFGKPLRDLSLAESAFLAGLPQAPSRLNPRLHYLRAKKRQQWILGRLRETGALAAHDYTRAAEQPLRLAPLTRAFRAPHFVDLLSRFETDTVAASSRTVPCPPQTLRTTLDLKLNQAAETVLRHQLSRLQAEHVKNGAIVIIDNRTGGVLALVGSDNYFAPISGQVNGAWAPRSAGSTFKPFTYLLALEQGATPASVVADVPTEFATSTGIFAPVNYDRHCYGPVSYRVALANSLNIPAVKVLASIGGPAVLQQRLQACGLTTLDQPADHYGLGLTIGNAEARLLELANAYACLARLGEFMPYRLLDQRSPVGSTHRVFDAGAAYLIADILSDNYARALAFGLDSSLSSDFPVACKTGTSTDFRDNWAFGYTPEFTVGVWVGNFDGTPMSRVSGVTGAAPILHELFVHLHDLRGTTWYAAPTNLVERWIHPITGKLCAWPGPPGIREKFLTSALPELEDPSDYDARGRVRLPDEYRDWFVASGASLADRLSVGPSPAPGALRLVAPLPGTTYYLDADLPAQGARLRLEAAGATKVTWHSQSLLCVSSNGQSYALLREGRHELTARDPISGALVQTWIIVNSR